MLTSDTDNSDKVRRYDLFCLVDENNVNSLVEKVKLIVGDGVKIKYEKELEPVYKAKEIEGKAAYITFIFSSTEEKLVELKKELSNVRHILLNLEREEKNAKIKTSLTNKPSTKETTKEGEKDNKDKRS